MKTTPLTLDLQAYVDGNLEPARKAEVERVLRDDAEARQLVEGLRSLSQLVRQHEPTRPVPASREFYWSQIQRRLDSAASQATHDARPASSALHWLRWLVPALGVAAVAVVVSLQRPAAPGGPGSNTDDTLTFHSDADGVTIHWVN